MRRIIPTPDLDAYVLTVAGIAARLCGASVVDVLTGRKGMVESRARRAVSYVLRKRLGLTLMLIGELLDCHYTTVVTHLQQVGQDLIDAIMQETESLPVPEVKLVPPTDRPCRCGRGRVVHSRTGKSCSYCRGAVA